MKCNNLLTLRNVWTLYMAVKRGLSRQVRDVDWGLLKIKWHQGEQLDIKERKTGGWSLIFSRQTLVHLCTLSSAQITPLHILTNSSLIIILLPKLYNQVIGSQDSAVGIATGYGLDGRVVGVQVTVRGRFFSSPHRPVRFWGPPILLASGYPKLFPRV
jgi:hypothetical protein